MHYWSAVKKTIQLFKLQYQVHKEDQAAKAAIKISVEAPPIAMENTEASADVATPVLQI
jgi:hypothetical protein